MLLVETLAKMILYLPTLYFSSQQNKTYKDNYNLQKQLIIKNVLLMTVNVFLKFGGMFLRLPLDRLLKPWTYIASGFRRDL